MSTQSGESSGSCKSTIAERLQTKKVKITVSNGKDILRNIDNTKSGKGRSRSGHCGTLALLPSLPLDILFEIFEHLLPLDLLHLARTTKEFRRVLMHKSSSSVWKAARSNVEGLPECPGDMSEPAFANLTFDQHCHNCSKKNIRNVDFRLRVRYCAGCAKKCLKAKADKMNEILLECVVFSDWCGNYDNECMYLSAQAYATKNEYDALPSDEKKKEYVQQKQSEVAKILEHAELCETWEGDLYDKRAHELDQLRAKRMADIVDRLTALGWGEEIHKLPKQWDGRYPRVVVFRDHPKVKDTKLLTDRTWQNIKDAMIQYMEEMKQHRIQKERAETVNENKKTVMSVYRQWRKSMEEEGSKHIPSLIDFCEFGPIKSLLQGIDEGVDREDFEEVIETRGKMAEFVTAWSKRIENGLMGVLEDNYFYRWDWAPFGILRSEPEDLELAITVFQCHEKRHLHCNWTDVDEPSWPPDEDYDRLWYPQVLHHKCNTLVWADWKREDTTADDPLLRLGTGEHGYLSHVRRQAWSCSMLSLDLKASKIVANIVMACGMDPRKTTVAALDKEDPRVVCLKCMYGHKCDGERVAQVRTWRNALSHCLKKHFGDGAIQWERVSDKDTQKAKDLEASFYTRNPTAPRKNKLVWLCTRCRDTTKETERCSLVGIRQHLREKHGISAAQQEGPDFYRALDAPPDQPPVISMKPGPSTVKPFVIRSP